jgi:tetratricopeptide (TPR) repeat protein
MSVDRIESLHQEASEHYLNGRFRDAIRVWNQVLSLDPSNEQALEGVRMSSLLGDESSLNDEIDQGLKVFELDSPAPQADPPRPVSDDADESRVGDLQDPSRQGDGIDFGDMEAVDPIPLADGEEASQETGLAPLAPKLPSVDPAVAELARRVESLLEEARSKASSGDLAGALAILGRVQVLDESNAEAAELEREWRSATEKASGEVDRWMIEGVQAYEAGTYDEARGWFLKVLGKLPEHAEAQHYLQEIANATSRSKDEAQAEPDDLLGSFLSNSESPPTEPDRPRDLGPEAPACGEEIPLAGDPRGEMAPEPPKYRPRDRRPVRAERTARKGRLRVGVIAAVCVLVAGTGLAAAWFVFSGGNDGSRPEEETARIERAPVKNPSPAPPEGQGNPAPPPPFGTSMTRARDAMSRNDFEGAILAYNDALRADPTSADARIGMANATEAYKVVKARREQIDRVRGAFEDGEYASALRVLYRLPEGFEGSTVERWKVNGWFNLAVIALRAGEVPQALQHFDEVLAIQDDQEARKWRAFSQRYVTLPKDRAYYAAAESIGFRSLED